MRGLQKKKGRERLGDKSPLIMTVIDPSPPFACDVETTARTHPQPGNGGGHCQPARIPATGVRQPGQWQNPDNSPRRRLPPAKSRALRAPTSELFGLFQRRGSVPRPLKKKKTMNFYILQNKI